MLEYGIIRECNEPSLFCSNLLVTKKKDGKSISVTRRTSTEPLHAEASGQPEIYPQLVGKVWLTVADLSDSFFQMMLKAECQAVNRILLQSTRKTILLHKMSTRPEELTAPSKTSPRQNPQRYGSRCHPLRRRHHDCNRRNLRRTYGKSWTSARQTKEGQHQDLTPEDQCHQKHCGLPQSSLAERENLHSRSKTALFHGTPVANNTKTDKRSSGNDWILSKIHTTLRTPRKTSW